MSSRNKILCFWYSRGRAGEFGNGVACLRCPVEEEGSGSAPKGDQELFAVVH